MTTTPQDDRPDREEVRQWLPGLVEPDLNSGRTHQLQEFVMNEIKDLGTDPKPRRGFTPRLAFAATAAAAAVAVAAVAIGAGALGTEQPADDTQGASDTAMTPAGRTIDLAANYAAAQPFESPTDGQWIYVENRNLATGSISQDKGQQPDVTWASWYSVDGTQMADIDPETDRFSQWDQENDYPFLSTLPTDPEALLDVFRDRIADRDTDSEAKPGSEEAPGTTGEDGETVEGEDAEGSTEPTDEELDALLFTEVSQALSEYLLPPEVTAALWQATALIPGVTELETVDVDGRELLAIGRIQEGWRFEQLLVDPETYAFAGIRSEASEDHTFDSPDGPIDIAAGEKQFEIIRIDAAVVDEAGQTG